MAMVLVGMENGRGKRESIICTCMRNKKIKADARREAKRLPKMFVLGWNQKGACIKSMVQVSFTK